MLVGVISAKVGGGGLTDFALVDGLGNGIPASERKKGGKILISRNPSDTIRIKREMPMSFFVFK